jgi:hypothetical protein
MFREIDRAMPRRRHELPAASSGTAGAVASCVFIAASSLVHSGGRSGLIEFLLDIVGVAAHVLEDAGLQQLVHGTALACMLAILSCARASAAPA